MSMLDSTPIDEAVRLADGSWRVAAKLGRALAFSALDDPGKRLAAIERPGSASLVDVALAAGLPSSNLAVLSVLREPLPWRRNDLLHWDHHPIVFDYADSDGTIRPIDDRMSAAIRERLGEEIEVEGHRLLVEAFGHRHSAGSDLSRKERDYWTRQGPEHLIGARDPAGAAALLKNAGRFVERIRFVGVDAAWPDGVEDEPIETLLRRHRDVLRRTPSAWPSLLYDDCIVRGMDPTEIEEEHGIRAGELGLKLRPSGLRSPAGSRPPLAGHRRGIVALSIASNGSMFVSADPYRVVRWDVDRDGVGHAEEVVGGVEDVAARSELQVLLAASAGSIREMQGREAPFRWLELEGHPGGTTCLASSPDGLRFASGGRDGTVAIWDEPEHRLERRLKGHLGEVVDLDWIGDASGVVSVSTDGTVREWRVDRPESRIAESREWRLERRESRIVASSERARPTACAVTVDVATDARCVVVGYDDGTVRMVRLDSGAPLWEARRHAAAVRAVATHPDGRIFTGSDDRTVHVWPVDRSEPSVLHAHAESVTCLGLGAGVFLSGSSDQTIIEWNVETLEPLRRYGGYGLPRERIDRPDVVRPPVSLDLGHRVYEGHADGRLVLRADGRDDRVHRSRSGVSSLRVGERGVVVGTDDGTIESLSPGLELGHSLRGHRRRVNGLALLDDGRLLSWSLDATLRLWDLDEGKLLATTHGAAPFVGVDLDPSDPLRFTAEDADGARWEMEVAPREGEEPRRDASDAGAAPFDVA
ncbi:MAG: WD40 repeat domain-containing protein [Planctomycetota bacterium JB042]